ncbi:MAG: RNA polymerase sigma-54 factor [Planctomycetota bacterium]|jgi:RNA polymerase sigma-54 factor
MQRMNLSQKQMQKLSPQQIQLMKLLQVTTANLEQRIEEELEINPALESGEEEEEKEYDDIDSKEKEETTEEDYEKDDEFDVDDYFQDDEIPDYKTYNNNHSADDEDKTIPIEMGISFHESLIKQLGTKKLSDIDRKVGLQIVGSIDDDGYLRREIANIVNDLAFSANVMVDQDKILAVLEIIQDFDPSGVGARDLRECLLIQLRKKDSTPPIRYAVKILDENFDLFSKKHYAKLRKIYNLEEDELKSVVDDILKLNPKPGGGYSGGRNVKVHQYIVPDFTVKNTDGELDLLLNMRNAPALKVSRSFRDMLETYKATKEASKQQKKDVMFIKQKIDAAKWFIDALRQRQQTLMLVMRAILDKQKAFFLTGDETKLRPMILKDIAGKVDLDISTVSRVANSKYVQTEFGVKLLKFFFSESMTNSDGEEVSTKEIKSILQDIINEENKKKPFSDQKLMEMLKIEGYPIARRTVAKYREQLSIPVARLRKEL